MPGISRRATTGCYNRAFVAWAYSFPHVFGTPDDEPGVAMWYVYIIRSVAFPEQEYTGATLDLRRRISEHNAGKSSHTTKFKPWTLIWYCAFRDKYNALE